MKVGDLLRLASGTPVFGLAYRPNSPVPHYRLTQPEMPEICCLDLDFWDLRVATEVRYTYFTEEVMKKLMTANRLFTTFHSEYIIPYLDARMVTDNFRCITTYLSFNDQVGYFVPKEFIGVLLGESIIGTNLFLGKHAPLAHVPQDEEQWEFEVFTKILLSDRIVWLRLWNYVPTKYVLGKFQLSDVMLKIKP